MLVLVACAVALPWPGRVEARAPSPEDALTAASPAAPSPAVSAAASTSLAASLVLDPSIAVAQGVSRHALDLAMSAVRCAVNAGDIALPPTLTLIDYSKPSVEPRLWVFDLRSGRMLFRELVAHGRNTGDNLANRFSDELNSLQSSLGLFVTRDTYVGGNGYSLRLDGLEPGFNGHARARNIVMHGAAYVSEAAAHSLGRLGRSWGCPALRTAIAAKVIDTIRGGGVVFSYYPDNRWLQESKLLNCAAASPEPAVLATR